LGFKGLLGLTSGSEFSREKWNSYPTFLKHTVFYQSKDYQKARKMEIGHKLFFLDKFKVKGNKYYKKGKYEKAITMYEKVSQILSEGTELFGVVELRCEQEQGPVRNGQL
jgi:tetratricopeptide (TPR) repeat protein